MRESCVFIDVPAAKQLSTLHERLATVSTLVDGFRAHTTGILLRPFPQFGSVSAIVPPDKQDLFIRACQALNISPEQLRVEQENEETMN